MDTISLSSSMMSTGPFVAEVLSLKIRIEGGPSNVVRRFSTKSSVTLEELKEHLRKFVPEGNIIDTIQYQDDEGDWISVDSQEEWEECIKLRNSIQLKVLQVKLLVKRKEAPITTVNVSIPPTQTQPIVSISTTNNTTSTAYNNEPMNSSSVAIHFGVTCNGCHKYNFTGTRYKCASCPDYDLCESCYKAQKHPFHPFTAYHVPANSTPTTATTTTITTNNTTPVTLTPTTNTTTVLPTTPTTTTTTTVSTTEQIHNGVACDGCKSQHFKGIRYKCGTCSDYDLCSSCYNKKLHPHHGFVAIATPNPLNKGHNLPPQNLMNIPTVKPVVTTNNNFQQFGTAPTSDEVFYSKQLKTMVDMGLTDTAACIKLLKKHNGDVNAAITDYFSESQPFFVK